MKTKTLIITLTLGIFMTVVGSFMVGYSSNKGKTRTTARTITGTYNNGTIETKDGNIWKVSNYNGIATNKTVKVTVKFDTKGTDSVLDDEIIEIKDK